MSKVTKQVISGDIAQVAADALITTINSGGLWFGGIDGVINRVAGDLFHSYAAQAPQLVDGQTIVARKYNRDHKGAFGDVVFVIDDLRRSLHEIVQAGLQAAADAGYKSVTLPTIRMGVMLGKVEKSKAQATREMAKGVAEFLRKNRKTQLQKITFVVYNDPETLELLQKTLKASQRTSKR